MHREFLLLVAHAAWTLGQPPAKTLRVAFLVVFSLLAAPRISEAQESKKTPRLCFLTFDPGTVRTRSPRFDEFFRGLQDLGYVDGRTINISYLSADGDNDRFPALIEECLSLNPDVIAVTTTPATHLLKKATITIPIVMVALGDPLGTGLVDSLAHPKENITGMSMMIPDLAAKRLELLKEAVPAISRVLVLSYLADPIAPLQVKAMQEAARKLDVTLQVRDVRTVDDIPAAFDAGIQDRAEGLLVTGESMFIVHRARVADLAARHKLPAVYPLLLPVTDAGGLMAYVVRATELHRRAAAYVDLILKGAKPSNLPIQQATKFDFVINLKTAKALGISIPPTLLSRATDVIE
jgi:putative tryptophan/tyrosine transport system substrate-binding protein